MPRLGMALARAVVVVSRGCGGGRSSERTTTITVFRLQNGALHAERAEVPAARSTPAAARGALGLDVPVNGAHRTARLDIGKLTSGRIAEVVYTLTHLPTVRRVQRVPVTVAG